MDQDCGPRHVMAELQAVRLATAGGRVAVGGVRDAPATPRVLPMMSLATPRFSVSQWVGVDTSLSLSGLAFSRGGADGRDGCVCLGNRHPLMMILGCLVCLCQAIRGTVANHGQGVPNLPEHDLLSSMGWCRLDGTLSAHDFSHCLVVGRWRGRVRSGGGVGSPGACRPACTDVSGRPPPRAHPTPEKPD
jgi:hypothetical protein